MALAIRSNLVTFEPAGWIATEDEPVAPRIVLNQCPISRRGGLQPDVWSAIVPYTQLARIGLGDVSIEVPGTVKLWYTYEPGAGAADVVLGNVAIVDVEPNSYGVVAGESVERVIEYKIAIADHRRAWIEPRGGRLFDGRGNPDPLPEDRELVINSVLMEHCAAAMGVSVTIAGDVDDVEPMRELDWSSAHAPSELQALLEHTGTVYAPLISGQGQIVKPGTAAAPTIPAGRLIRDVLCKSIDRRATRVVFTSAPAAKIFSYNSTATGDGVPTWKYVAQDPQDDDRWKPLDDIAALGGTASTAWANDLKDVAEDYRAQLREQMYRCIQIDPMKCPPGRVVLLTEYINTDLVGVAPHIKLSTLLYRLANGSFGQQPSDARLFATSVVQEANVLVFPQPLLKLASASTTARRQRLTSAEVPLAESAIKPNFSAQGWDATLNARQYSVFGFTATFGGVGAASSSTAKSWLTGYRPDTIVLNSPDLVEVSLNSGASTNTSDMQDRAETYALGVLALSQPPLRIITVKGFLAVEIDAAVSEVAYDPGAVTTTITLNGWACTARSGGRR